MAKHRETLEAVDPVLPFDLPKGTRTISLNSVTIEGFKSFREPQTFFFSETEGLKFLGGLNLQNTRLGANGAGKSTVWEAICWCLWNTSPTGDKASDLVNWDWKQPIVETSFYFNERLWTVRRSGMPDRLFLDGKQCAQSDIIRLFCMGKERFLQSVIYGQSAPLFLDLSVTKRGELLDEVLDLNLWADASDLAAAKIKGLNAELADKEKELALIVGELKGLPDKSMLRVSVDEWQDKQTKYINDKIESFITLEETIKKMELSLMAALDAYEKERSLRFDKLSTKKARDDLQNVRTALADLTAEYKHLDRHLKLLASNERCPTCGQPIHAEFLEDETIRIEDELDRLTNNGKLLRADERKIIDQIEDYEKRNEERDEEIARLRGEVGRYMYAIPEKKEQLRGFERELEELSTAKNPYSEWSDKVEVRRKALSRSENKVSVEFLELEGKVKALDYWAKHGGFKRVRLFLIKQVLTALEVEIASAASALGIIDWKIRLETETETKGGTIRPGVQVLVQSPEAPGYWTVWSGGEKQRIRLAVTIGLSNMIQRMSGVRYTFEVWDEPSNHLSDPGIDDLLECLRYRAETSHKSIWLVDHRTLAYAGFAETWRVLKTPDNGSKFELLAREE